jgi:hypothetical protein
MKGIKLLVATNFKSQAMTAYPITKATQVAIKVSPSEKADGAP